ncbi:MAG: VWA domain-containing protein, partial [Holophagales bacterium]|nr:VWA domain-containing protein [Holophagales bacterium]
MSVYVVNVDVRVTDRRGNPVTGLEAADFTLREDGDRVEISNFLEVPPRSPESPGTVAAPEADEASEADSVEPAPATLVILLDDLGISRQHRQLAVEQTRRALEAELDPTVEVAVALFDGAIRLVQQPTLDRQQALAGLDLLGRASPRGQVRLQERDAFLRQVLSEVGRIRSEVRSGLILPEEGVRRLNVLSVEVDSEAGRRRIENRNTYAALGALVDALAALPGRKALLYLSGGLSIRPGQAELQVIQDALFELGSGG